MGAGDTWMAGNIGLGRGQLQQRQADIEGGIRLARVVDDLDGSVPDGGDRPRIANCDERRQIEGRAIIPAFGDNFRADAGRISE